MRPDHIAVSVRDSADENVGNWSDSLLFR